MPDLTFTRTTAARGRNRWFTLDHGWLGGGHDCWLELFSKREGRNAPILLRFTETADMRILGLALLAEAEARDHGEPP